MQLRPWWLWTPDGQPAHGVEEVRGFFEPTLARARARRAVPLLHPCDGGRPRGRALAVADAVLAGEIDCRRGDLDAAFAQLRSAVELDASSTTLVGSCFCRTD
jgi:hypothetical protein